MMENYSRLRVWANIRAAINGGLKDAIDGHDPLLARRLIAMLDDIPRAEQAGTATTKRQPISLADRAINATRRL